MNLVTDYAERSPEKSVEIIPGRQKGQDRTQVHGRQAGSVQMIKKAINESKRAGESAYTVGLDGRAAGRRLSYIFSAISEGDEASSSLKNRNPRCASYVTCIHGLLGIPRYFTTKTT
jgi:hypothetical protein